MPCILLKIPDRKIYKGLHNSFESKEKSFLKSFKLFLSIVQEVCNSKKVLIEADIVFNLLVLTL